jgi:hypothetical protein
MPRLVLHLEGGRILNAGDLGRAPDWAKPIIAAGIKAATGSPQRG